MKFIYLIALIVLPASIAAKKFCMDQGLRCGPDVKPCCPYSYCDSVTGRCEPQDEP